MQEKNEDQMKFLHTLYSPPFNKVIVKSRKLHNMKPSIKGSCDYEQISVKATK